VSHLGRTILKVVLQVELLCESSKRHLHPLNKVGCKGKYKTIEISESQTYTCMHIAQSSAAQHWKIAHCHSLDAPSCTCHV
jgi:hypothetical protein